MTSRDRLVITAVSALVVLAVMWLLLVAPERKQAAELGAQLGAQGAQLASAESKLASARTAYAKYATTYASLVQLGKAVPAAQEVPSLIYELAHATNQRSVDFESITTGSGSASSSSASAPAAAAPSSGLTEVPLTLSFTGSFLDLYHLMHQLDSLTSRTASGALAVHGRLLTIQSVKLAPAAAVASGEHSAKGPPQLTGTITATAYELPVAQGLAGGAPAAAGAAAPSTVSSTSSSASAPTAPAIVRAP